MSGDIVNNSSPRDLIARAVCWVSICHELSCPLTPKVGGIVETCWGGFVEEADEALRALAEAGYVISECRP